ncbi:MAG TPA: thioesterase family protein [Candidatus Methylomirabilis sp.]|jgi:predicted thioesterase
MGLEAGMAHEVQYAVGPGTLASDMGNPGVNVLGTPTIFRWVENAATDLVVPHLPPGQSTVGTFVVLRHLAATPPGMAVRARATLREVEGRHLHFSVELFDEREKIAEAEHERVIVDLRRFLDRVATKKS